MSESTGAREPEQSRVVEDPVGDSPDPEAEQDAEQQEVQEHDPAE